MTDEEWNCLTAHEAGHVVVALHLKLPIAGVYAKGGKVVTNMGSPHWYTEFPQHTHTFLVAGAAGEQLCENPCDEVPQKKDREQFAALGAQWGCVGTFESHIPEARKIIEIYPEGFQRIRKRVKSTMHLYGATTPFYGETDEEELIGLSELNELLTQL